MSDYAKKNSILINKYKETTDPILKKEYLDQIFDGNLYMVYMVIGKVLARYNKIITRNSFQIEESELFSECYIYFQNILDRFDPEKKIKFSTFFVNNIYWRLRGIVIDYINSQVGNKKVFEPKLSLDEMLNNDKNFLSYTDHSYLESENASFEMQLKNYLKQKKIHKNRYFPLIMDYIFRNSDFDNKDYEVEFKYHKNNAMSLRYAKKVVKQFVNNYRQELLDFLK